MSAFIGRTHKKSPNYLKYVLFRDNHPLVHDRKLANLDKQGNSHFNITTRILTTYR